MGVFLDFPGKFRATLRIQLGKHVSLLGQHHGFFVMGDTRCCPNSPKTTDFSGLHHIYPILFP